MKKYDIVVIDTGVTITDKDNEIDGIAIGVQNNQVQYYEDINDTYGHGTSIYSVIKHNCKDAEIYVIKLNFNQNRINEIEPIVLIKALEHIFVNIECDFINISLGIKGNEYYDEIDNICNKLKTKKCVIISALDNDGTLSLPASLNSVIGVDCGKDCFNTATMEYVEESPINVLAYGGKQIGTWKDGKRAILSGSSYACAYVTVNAYRLLKSKNRDICLENVLNEIRSSSQIIYKGIKRNHKKVNVNNINRAIIFPFNKEMHSLIRFQESLSFSIIDIYESRYSGRVGKKVSALLDMDGLINDYIIKDISQISWKDFDTLILGHIGLLISITKNQVFTRKLLEML